MNKPIKLSVTELDFIPGNVLYAAQLTTLKEKIDQIIDYLPDSFASQSDTQQPTNPSDTQTTDTTRLTELENYLALLENSNKNINKNITDLYNKVQNLASGSLVIDNKEQFAKGIIDSTFAALLNMQLLKKETIDGEEVYSCAIDLAAINKLTGMASFLEILPGSAGLIATNFEQNSSGEWVPKYDGARIIASINESGNSAVKISADFINLEGYVKTSELEALNITANDTLTGVHIKGGDININDKFIVEPTGHVIADSITLNGQGHSIIVQPGGTYYLPESRPGACVWIVNKYPTTQPSMAEDIYIRTLSYNNYNRSNLDANSFIRQYDLNDGWNTNKIQNACQYDSSFANLMIVSMLVCDGKDWWEAYVRTTKD